MSKKKAVLFDVDGTLVDSNDYHTEAFIKAFSENGCEVEFETVRKLIGKGGDKLIEEASGLKPDSEKAKKVSKRKNEIFKSEYLPKIRAFPGAKELVEGVKASGVTVVAASSASAEDLKALLNIVGVEETMSDATSKDDVENSKPDPDIVLEALKKAGCLAHEALMIGDTPYDITAASRAQVDSIGVLTGGWAEEDLSGAKAVYRNPEHLLENLKELLRV